MNRLRRRFIGWVVVLMLLVCACATPPEPYEYVPDNEIKPGPGLLTGEEGTLTIYRKAMPVEPEKNAASKKTKPSDPERK